MPPRWPRRPRTTSGPEAARRPQPRAPRRWLPARSRRWQRPWRQEVPRRHPGRMAARRGPCRKSSPRLRTQAARRARYPPPATRRAPSPVPAVSAAKPEACRPVVSTTSTGLVAPSQMTQTRPMIEIAGINDTKNCPSTVRAGTPRLRPPTAARRPVKALRLAAANGARLGGTGTRDSSSLSLGARRGLQLGDDDHVADVQSGQHDPGEERAGVELDHRHARGRAVDDQQHRRRNQDAEAAARGDRACGEPGRRSRRAASRGTRAGPSASPRRRRCRSRWRISRR